MSLFDDDFYSTKMKRRTSREYRPGFGGGRGRGGTNIRTVIVSSLAGAAAALLLFVLISGGKEDTHTAMPALAGGQPLVETSERIISASDKIRPTVVSVINYMQEVPASAAGGKEDGVSELPPNSSLGSGVIFEKKGGKAHIITNAHVVAGAVHVQAVLMDGTKKDAEIVGQDAISDLAVLAVDADGIDQVAEIGSSEKLRVGEMVIAVGNPLGFGDSVTQGIVSFLHRIVPVSLNQDGYYDWEQEVVQTTAAINQGNSGGVLADLNGKVVGINSMKIADTGVEGIGFAIPIDAVMPIVEQLIEEGKVLRPYLGVYSMDLSVYLDHAAMAGDPEDEEDAEDEQAADEGEGEAGRIAPVVPDDVTEGALILEAVGPAKEAGLQLNDVITELDGHPIDGTLDLRKYLYNEKKIGESITITYYRDGKQAKLKLTLAEKDQEE